MAIEMLKSLSGRTHTVLTAIVLLYQLKNTDNVLEKSFVEETKVRFADLPDEWIQSYVDSGEPMDKAGGYGYQGLAAFLIHSISGCYYNVIGFPAHKFLSTLSSIEDLE